MKTESTTRGDAAEAGFLLRIRVGGYAVALLGAVVVLGKLTGVEILRRAFPDSVLMTLSTAVALVVSGIALALLAGGVGAKRVGSLLGVLVAAVGAAQMIHDVAGLGSGFDAILVSESTGVDGAPRPDRMAALTALALILSGSSLFLLRGGRVAVGAARIASALVLLLAVSSVFGSAFAVTSPQQLGDSYHMRLSSALGLGALGVIMSYLGAGRTPDALLVDTSVGGDHVRRVLPAVFLVPLLFGLAAAIGLRAEWFGQGFAAALVSTLSVAVLSGLVYLSGQRLRLLDRSRRTAVSLLSGSEELFRSTFENALDGIAHVGVDGSILRANRHLAQMLRYDATQPIPARLSALVPESDYSTLASAMESLLTGTLSEYLGEHRCRTSSGAEVWGVVRVTLQRNQAKDPQFFIIVVTDVTDRRETQALLRVHQRAMQAASYGIVIADAQAPDHPIVDINPAFERLTGFRREEVLGRNCRMLNRLARDQEGLQRIRTALARAEPQTEVLLNHRKDGSPFWIRLSLTPVLDSKGVVTHFVGIQEDITAQIRAEKEREDLLAKALAEREAAEKANRARDMLLAVVSHELRSPLNAVRLWASLLLADPSPSQVECSAKQIEASVASQSRLINDLIDISRISSGKLELHRERVELDLLVSAALEALQANAAQKAITLTFACHAQEVIVSADRERIAQVLRNLVENAIKFTPKDGRILVELFLVGDECELRVTDTGVGIPAEHLPRIFDRFWQADGRDTRVHGGLGLGLSIVKHVVERLGGRVEASSEGADRGTRFSLWLPILSGETGRRVTAQPEVLDGAKPLQGGDVLVVEDDLPTAEALAIALQLRGMSVRVVNGVEPALAAIRLGRPRILISDLMMPGRSGLELLEELRAEERRSHSKRLYAIAITGRGARTDRRRLRRAGFDAYVAKPVDVRSLLAAIAAASEGRRVPTAVHTILVVDDFVDLAMALAERLRQDGHTVHVAHTARAARELATSHPPDVLITDLRLPDGLGDDLAREFTIDHVDLLTIGMTGSHVVSMDKDVFDHVMEKPIRFDDLAQILERSIRF